MAALSEAGILPPDEVIGLLPARLATLDKDNAAAANREQFAGRLPRLLLIEAEYQLAMRLAEAGWVRKLLGEIAEGLIGDMDAWRHMHETGKIPPEFAELDEQAKRGWVRRAEHGQADSNQTVKATPVHGAATPRPGVVTSPPAPRVNRGGSTRPNDDSMPGTSSRN